MRSRRSANDEVADVARRRLEQLSAELAAVRLDPSVDPVLDRRQDPGVGPGRDPGVTPGRDPGLDSERVAVRSEPTWPASSDQPVSGREPTPGRHAHRPVGLMALVAGWVLDRLPPIVQGRFRMSAGHLGVVALMVVGMLGVTAWWVLRADGGRSDVQPVPVVRSAGALPASADRTTGGSSPPVPTSGSALVTVATPSTAAVAGGSTPSPSATSGIVVDVAGKVRRPGIATLPAGARVVDALKAAGGARRGTRLGSLNLARVLTDGEQIVVGVPAPPGLAASAASAPTSGAAGAPVALVNINTASQTELEELPQVGPVTAQSILDFRAENGTFTSVDQLLEVSGIGDATLAKIAPYVTL
jgi:competence protein ComEA